MDKYMATGSLRIRGQLGVARVVATGQAEVTFDTMANVTLGLKNNGQPTDACQPILALPFVAYHMCCARRIQPPVMRSNFPFTSGSWPFGTNHSTKPQCPQTSLVETRWAHAICNS
jgi:hypothetical protein